MEIYRKNINTALDVEYKEAEPFGNIKLGKTHIFCKKLIKTMYVDIASVTRAYRRIEEAKGRTGCCSNDFSIHFLMLETGNGETLKLKIGEALYRHEPEALMEKFRTLYPSVPVGFEGTNE